MENALIPLLTAELDAETAPMCNARNLHTTLQVGRDFSNWIKGRIEEYGFVENIDFLVIDSPNLANQSRGVFPKSGEKIDFPKPENQKKGRGGDRRSIDYHLTLDMAKELAMIENNEIGRAVRRYFIQAEKTLREKLLAELRDKAAHVLPVRGVKLMRDGLSMRDTLKLQEQSRKVLRMMMEAQSKAERQNLHYHLRQINLTLGVPTIELVQIEAEIDRKAV